MIRLATREDIALITEIYNAILENEERKPQGIGWIRGVYPTEETARDALAKHTLFVYEEEGKIVASAKIDQTQVPEYRNCKWEYNASAQEVMVLHTLVVDPICVHKGYGKQFVAFYEQYAQKNNCHYLRMDTNKENMRAREMYKKLGYKEAGTVSCMFNGIPDVQLVCLEKKI